MTSRILSAWFILSLAILAGSTALIGGCTAAPSHLATASHALVDSTHSGSAEVRPLPLPVPAGGEIPVAFVLGKDAEVLDFCGPLEVFAGAWTKDGRPLFKPYFVAASRTPVVVGGGMRIVPDYTFATAPAPKVIVIPAMGPTPDAMIDWIRKVSPGTDVTISVCNGAFVLARTGLLDGKPATSHHGGYFRFAGTFPKVQLQRGARFVETGNLASAGGISSGIDLALRVVERYVGKSETQALVDGMEYQGTGWLDPKSNAAYAKLPKSTAQEPVCPLCRMSADTTIRSVFRGKTYYFCSKPEKQFFDEHPSVVDRFLAEDAAPGAPGGR
jgi:putative intracellular protease/amidase/YHS domain-containing protein